jgi:hypothetical protein
MPEPRTDRGINPQRPWNGIVVEIGIPVRRLRGRAGA